MFRMGQQSRQFVGKGGRENELCVLWKYAKNPIKWIIHLMDSIVKNVVEFLPILWHRMKYLRRLRISWPEMSWCTAEAFHCEACGLVIMKENV